MTESEDLHETKQRALLCEELEKEIIESDEDKYFQIGTQLPLDEKEELLDFLGENIDVFAWSVYKAYSVDPDFIYDYLNVNLATLPKRQSSRRSSKEHVEAIKEEVNKLKQVGAIKETFYLEWLANTVVMKKKLGKWSICVDFTDLNKVFPKDHFLVPRIE